MRSPAGERRAGAKLSHQADHHGRAYPALDALVAALQTALKDGNVKLRLGELGTEPVARNRATPDALRTQLKSEIDKWAPVIRKAGQYAD